MVCYVFVVKGLQLGYMGCVRSDSSSSWSQALVSVDDKRTFSRRRRKADIMVNALTNIKITRARLVNDGNIARFNLTSIAHRSGSSSQEEEEEEEEEEEDEEEA
jgi:hypothetical protein